MDGLVGFLQAIFQFELFCLDFVNSCGSLLKLRHGLVLGRDGLSEGPSISNAHHFWNWNASTFDGVLSELAPFVGLVVHGDNFYEDGSVGPWISTWLAEIPSRFVSLSSMATFASWIFQALMPPVDLVLD